MQRIKVSFDTWIQLIGMFSIVASLIFVGLEMRQSQRIALASQQGERVSYFLSMVDSLSESQISYREILSMASGGTPIKEEYRWAVDNVGDMYWWIVENDFLQYTLGLMDENIWQAKLAGLRGAYNMCPARYLWEIRRNTTDSRLVSLVESFPDNCAD